MMGTRKTQSDNDKDSNSLQGEKTIQGILHPVPKRLYTLPEAAQYLGRTLWSMRELVWKGSIAIIREGKRIFVDIRDMDDYINRNRHTFV